MTMRQWQTFLALILTCFSAQSLAGSAAADLSCASASGRTQFKAAIQDIVGPLYDAELKIDGVALAFDDGDEAHIVYKPRYGLYTIIIESQDPGPAGDFKALRFWALPATFKTAAQTATGEDVWTFEAQIEASEPRPDKEVWTPLIQINCRMVYGV